MTPRNCTIRFALRSHYRSARLLLGLAVLATSAAAQINLGTPPEMEGVDVTQKLGAQIPLDARFRDERGRDVTLAEYFDSKRPVILVLNYFKCPQLCGLLLNQLVERMKELDAQAGWVPGNQYRVLAVSFEPLEGPQQAAAKKRAYLLEFGKSEAADGLHFLTGEKVDISRLEDAVGYVKRWSPDRQEWIHPSAIMLCTPRGIVSRYLGGLDYDAQTLRLSLVEASQGKTGSLWDKIFLTCYVYESHSGRYVPYAMGIMRAGGAVMVVVMSVMLLSLWRLDAARRRRIQNSQRDAGTGPDGADQSGK
jgi:protein SCO1/2